MYDKLEELYPSSEASLEEERMKLEADRISFKSIKSLLDDVLI